MNRIFCRSALAMLLIFFITGTSSIYAQESVAEKVGEKTRKFLGGLKDGFTREGEKRDQVEIVLSERAQKTKLEILSAKHSGFEEVLLNEGITCYIKNPVAFKGRMVAKALGKNGVEMGQSRQLVTLDADTGKNIVFDFPRSLDTKLVEKYEIDLFESAIQVDLQPEIESKLGLSLTQIEEPSDKTPKTLSMYAIAKKTINARLTIQAFNPQGQEIDRSQKILRMKPKDSHHLNFAFTHNQGATRYSITYEEGSGLIIEQGKSLQPFDLEISRTREMETADKNLRLNSYVIANKKFSGKIIAKALDEEGNEIGRGTVTLNMKADDARDLEFNFPASTATEQIKKIVIDARIDEEEKAAQP